MQSIKGMFVIKKALLVECTFWMWNTTRNKKFSNEVFEFYRPKFRGHSKESAPVFIWVWSFSYMTSVTNR
jgi:hypothetical protein